MKNKIINTFAILIIGLGSFVIAEPVEAIANDSECSNWQLSCTDDDYCCTICQDNGDIGRCFWRGQKE